MKTKLNTRQKIAILLVVFVVVLIGFMVKLPSSFRSIDKELHTAFYFLAAAFLNFLFSIKNELKHAALFVILYLFGVLIEYMQAYSNKFFSKRIHGRYDYLDVQANLKGLVAFSIIWLVIRLGLFFYRKVIAYDYEKGK